MNLKPRPIPEFNSTEEEQEFWDNHSALEFLDEKSVVEVDVTKAREKRDHRQQLENR